MAYRIVLLAKLVAGAPPPTPAEIDLVRDARFIYVTHSHPDHLHFPSIRHLRAAKTFLSPNFPGYPVPGYLEGEGHAAITLRPFRWYRLGAEVRVAFAQVPIDDSILVIDTPSAAIVNINDSYPPRRLLKAIGRRLLAPGKKVVVLKSYSPASTGSSTYRDGVRAPLKEKRDFVQTAQSMAEALGADVFVPFASQAFFNRRDSRWANEFKVSYEDIEAYWTSPAVKLSRPFVELSLETMDCADHYDEVERTPGRALLEKVEDRHREEESFKIGEEFDTKLLAYMRSVFALRVLYPNGLGWRLTSSGQERFYDPRRRRLSQRIPESHDLVISLPDQVLSEGLDNGILTDIGITQFVRVDTRIGLRRTYLFFLLMGLRDYGHSRNLLSRIKYAVYYVSGFVAPDRFPFAGGKEIRLDPSHPLD